MSTINKRWWNIETSNPKKQKTNSGEKQISQKKEENKVYAKIGNSFLGFLNTQKES